MECYKVFYYYCIAFNFSLKTVNINFIHHGILWLNAYIFINILLNLPTQGMSPTWVICPSAEVELWLLLWCAGG